ncbi:MAG: ATP synthase F1 subunit delta [Acidobacteria bacterium]|nr:ATP synthase F1 subunit delta [Acidobacteriota bacterium]
MSTGASASRYARALLEAIVTDGNPEQVEQDLTAFADLVARAPELQRVFANPAVPPAAKRGIVETLLSRMDASPPVVRLLRLFAERDRLAVVGELAAAYRERLTEYRRIVRAEVTTAAPLGPDALAQLEQRLASATGRRVTMSARVDPAIIGGAVARVGSVVYDGSIATQLQRIRERLEERR